MAKTTQTMHNDTELHAADTHAETHHAGPHIPLIQGESVWGAVSNVTVTLFLFLGLVSLFSFLANRSLKKHGKLSIAVANFIQFFDSQLRQTFGEKKMARAFFPLAVGIFCIIFFGNLLGLVIDWIGISVSPTVLQYLRPIHSDLNTTLVLAAVTMFTYLLTQVKTHGGWKATKSYLFNFSGENVMSRCINVFVGWLHFIGIFATTASLSLRLFGNIFAGIVLVGIITYLGSLATQSLFEAGRLLSVPFWFFEVFVALIQALVFLGIMLAQFKQAGEEH